MIYGLIEVKPKMNKTKIIIGVLIVLILILLFVILGIIISKNTNINKNEKIDNIAVIESSEDKGQSKIKTKHEASVNLLPKYTQQAKQDMNNIYHLEGKNVYLTFDDGPSKSVTPLILDLLKKENIPVTFFVLGSRAELNPDILRREYEEGHYIANHGYSHIYSNIYSSKEAILEEYNKTENAIKNILGLDYKSHLFRFPGGSTGGKYKQIKADAKTFLSDNEICYIDWNSLSQDAAGAKTIEALVQNTIDSVGTKNNVVILMHDAGDKILTYEALPQIISYLRENGYTFRNFYTIFK